MKNLILKNYYGAVLLEPKEVAFAKSLQESINRITNAIFICSNAKLLDEQGNEFKYNGRPLFFENQEIHMSFIPNPQFQRNRFSLLLNGIKQFQSKRINNQCQLSGSINFENSVGLTNIIIRNSTLEKDIFSIKTEVYPQKIDYKNDFDLMLHEITEIIYNLAFDYFRKTYLQTAPIDTVSQTLSQWLTILKHVFDRFIKSIDLIIKNPNYKIVSTKIVRDISCVRKLDRKVAKWILKNKKYIRSSDNRCEFKILNKYICTHLPEYRKRLSYDTFENRFVVWGIKQIILKLNEIEKYLYSLKVQNERFNNNLKVINNYRIRLLRRLSDQYFSDVEDFNNRIHFSTVLTMAPGYKDFYYNFLLLRKGLALSENEIFNLDLKNISTLYEYWCFLKIIKILRDNDKYDLEGNDFIKLEHNKFIVELKKGRASKVEFTKNDTNEKIKIFYNKYFNTPTYGQKPDNFIEFRKDGYSTPFWYFFDAKYRFDKGNELDYPEKSIPYGPPQDAIGQMHRYRDAILEKSAKNQIYSQAIKSLGGVILFPYPDEESQFKKHHFYKSIFKVNIGAIPLHPGKENRLFKIFLDELFSKTPESNFEHMIDYDKSEYNDFVSAVKTPVLIGMIRKNLSKERIDYLMKNLKFYIHKTTNPNAFLIKYVVIYNQKTKKITGYSKVKDIYFGSNKGLIKPTQNEYLFYSLAGFDELNVDFSFGSLGQKGYFFTNYFVFKKLLAGENKNILKLNNFQNIRMWKEIKNIDTNCKVIRKKFKLDKYGIDVSPIEIVFRFNDVVYNCIQNNIDKDTFYINKIPYRISEDLYNFLISLQNNH